MARSVQPELSAFFENLHKSHGVEIVCDAVVDEFVGKNGHVSGVRTTGGRLLDADLVVVGVGVVANVELAQEAGLACDNGIIVDEFGRTNDPHIYAVGDCACYEHPIAGQRIRLESVQNAGDQARAAAAKIAGKDKPYTAVPWFWSDQYDVKLQIAGLTHGCDRHIVRGDVAGGRFSILHFKGDKLHAVEAINQPRDYIVGRKLLEKGLSPSFDQAEDTKFELKSLLA
jgi:3-phenylpropionate/trans-cinnamate dioxygenase ferredoxin reductase subunit